MERKELGRIQSAKFGHGGYQDAMLGVTFTLGGKGWGVGDFWGMWSPGLIKHSDNCKWTEESRDSQFAELLRKVDALLVEAKVSDFNKLIGLPVEVALEDGTLKSWRLLSEVLP